MASKLVFTDRQIKALRSTGARLEMTDVTCRGLTIRVTANQVKTWSLSLRRAGQRYRVTLGTYPDMSLVAARAAADRARADIAEGRTGKASKVKGEKPATFDALCAAFLENIEGQKIQATYKYCLKRPRAEFGRTDPAKLGRREIRDFLEGLAKNHPVMANRTQAAISRVLNWAVDQEHIAANPIAGVRRAGKEQSRARTLDAREIKTLWTKIGEDGSPASLIVGYAIKTVLVSAQRPGEIAGLRFDELKDFEGAQPIAELPGDRMKAGRPHSWPVTATARALIKAAQALRPAKDSAFVFPARRKTQRGKPRGDQPITRAALSKALSRFCEQHGLAPFSTHDLRRTANSIASAEGIPMEYSERLLAHKLPGLQAVYNRHSYMAEKRACAEAIERHVLRVVGA